MGCRAVRVNPALLALFVAELALGGHRRPFGQAERTATAPTRHASDHCLVADDRQQLRTTFDSAADLYHQARPDYPEPLYDTLVQAAGLSVGGCSGWRCCGGSD
jgi:hypothetical protein